jgi:2'-5' RNA ligase
MIQRKIFIGIDLPQQVKKRLSQKIEVWKDLPVKWSREDNFHLTLFFIGHIDDESLLEICEKVQIALSNLSSFDVSLQEISIGPNAQKPQRIWLTGEANEQLRELEESIAKEIGIFVSERKEFCPHVTLGRIQVERWKNLPETPEIKEKFSVSIPVENVEIFESVMNQGKKKYLSIESFPLS